MQPFTCSLSHLDDSALLHSFCDVVARDHRTTAEMLAHLGEIAARRLYAPAGYPAMLPYVIGHWGMSEGVALKRLQAASAARRFPAILTAVADGRLHLTAVGLLAPHLTEANAAELITASSGHTKSEIVAILAAYYRVPDRSGLLDEASQQDPHNEHDPDHVPLTDPEHAPAHAPGEPPGLAIVPPPPISAPLHVALDQETQALLDEVRLLLGAELRCGDPASVVRHALREVVVKLRRRRERAATRPSRPSQSQNEHYIPLAIQNVVWERDGGKCTFVSESGRRCGSNMFLELDHVQPVACGGLSTVENLRVVCRAHNQYAAEQAFGAGFVEAKREAAREARREAEQARKRLEAEAKAEATRVRALAAAEKKRQEAEAKEAVERERKAREEADRSLVGALRRLGFGAAEVRDAIDQGEGLRGARLEDRVRHALRVLNSARGKPSEAGASTKA